ncbi:MAG: hypothetical protein R2851_09060 [Caldilineaceae bacterium]
MLTLGVLLLVNALAQQVTEITAISNFVSAGGAAGMLIVWSIDGALVIGLTAAQSLVVDRFSRLLVGALMLLLALVFALLWLLFLLNVPPVVNYAVSGFRATVARLPLGSLAVGGRHLHNLARPAFLSA